MANAMLRQEAVELGVTETILIREGWVTEGAASNVFIVQNAVVLTPPAGPHLLEGVTRNLVIELLKTEGIPLGEVACSEAMLHQADEVWITSSSLQITPVTELDGQPVGQGDPGSLWRVASGVFEQYRQAFIAGNESDKSRQAIAPGMGTNHKQTSF
jgi:D-alanine transaminase